MYIYIYIVILSKRRPITPHQLASADIEDECPKITPHACYLSFVSFRFVSQQQFFHIILDRCWAYGEPGGGKQLVKMFSDFPHC